jgi:hypothetical protein
LRSGPMPPWIFQVITLMVRAADIFPDMILHLFRDRPIRPPTRFIWEVRGASPRG